MSHYHAMALSKISLVKLEFSTTNSVSGVLGLPVSRQFNSDLQKVSLVPAEQYDFPAPKEGYESLNKRYSHFSNAALRPDVMLKTREEEYLMAERIL